MLLWEEKMKRLLVSLLIFVLTVSALAVAVSAEGTDAHFTLDVTSQDGNNITVTLYSEDYDNLLISSAIL